MTKSRYALNSYTLSELKSQIAIKLRFPINGKPDCLKLSELLLQEGYGSISATTLYRLLVNFNGIIPYQNTLDILANFLGFTCWSYFVEKVESKTTYNNTNLQKDATKSLIFHSIEAESTKPLISFFESIAELDYTTKKKITLEVYDSLLKVKNTKYFFSKFSTNYFVKTFVLEDAFDPFFRIKNYDYAYKLFCDESRKEKSIEYLQDYVFSRAVLFRHFYFTYNLEEALEIGNKLFNEYAVNSNDLNSIFIFPNIRYRAYKLWYLALLKKSDFVIENYVEELLDFCRFSYLNCDASARKIVFHTVAEVFCSLPINKKYHFELKTIFGKEFEDIPLSILKKPLQKSLPYFEVNGLLYYRPV